MDKTIINKAIQHFKKGIELLENELTQKEVSVQENEPIKESTKPIPDDKPVHIFIDAGHGGINPTTKQYVTAPSKMWKHKGYTEFHKGEEFYEGVFNRQVAKELAQMLQDTGISWSFAHHDWKDTPLVERINKVNYDITQLHKKGKQAVFFSIHGNGSSNPRAEGFSVFVFERASRFSMNLADFLGAEMIKDVPEFSYRRQRPNDYSWKSRFYVLKTTKCPAILSENGFFTNLEDTRDMMRPEFIRKIAKQHFDTAVYAQTLFNS